MKASVQPIDVNTEDLKLLVERAREAPLEEAGCRKLHALIDTFEYVTLLLEDKQTTIQALRQLLLKPSTEKTEKILQEAGVAASEKPSKPPGTKTPKKAKGHGRNSAESYKAAPKIKISHPLLKPGDHCPKCQEGKVYAQREPGLLVVSFQQRCVTGKGSRSERSGSVQLPEEQANAHSNIAIHLRLSRRSRHEVTATPALVQRHPSDMNLLSFQRASEQNRIGGDPSHQTGSSTLLANNPVAGFRFARHANSF